MRKCKILLALAIAFTSFATTMGQNGTMTPYSRYGYGILNDNATSAQRAMGGVGYAMNSGRQTNVMNPASYAAIDSLTFLFDMGVNLSLMHAKEGDLSENQTGGGLDYITMAFPISKQIGASIGLLPFSSTGYSFGETITNASVSRAGNGDLNQAYIGVGYTPIKNTYIGFNFAYLFGNITNDVYAYATSNATSLFERYMRVSDWRLDIGAQYTYEISDIHSLTIGATFSPGKDLHGETYAIYYEASSSSVVPDTVGDSKLKGLYSIPASFGGGLSYRMGSRLLAEIDVTYQPWSKAKYANIEGFETSKLVNRYKIAGGLQFTPAARGNYLQRIQYRAGAYYNRDYITVRGNNVRDIGVTVGFGLPVPQFKSIVNLGFEYKNRQATPTPLVKEEYFNITLGINFNELWFRKAKIY